MIQLAIVNIYLYKTTLLGGVMSKLEEEIRDYLINKQVSDMTATDIAEYFFVSRSYVYKVLNRMGYKSFSKFKEAKLLQEVRYEDNTNYRTRLNKETINHLVDELDFTRRVIIIGFHGSAIVAEYMSRQLVNLGIFAIYISERKSLNAHLKIISDMDIVLFLSNTGFDEEIQLNMGKVECSMYVVTQFDSLIYHSTPNHIGIVNNINTLSNQFERENVSEMVVLVQIILNLVKRKLNYIHNKNT